MHCLPLVIESRIQSNIKYLHYSIAYLTFVPNKSKDTEDSCVWLWLHEAGLQTNSWCADVQFAATPSITKLCRHVLYIAQKDFKCLSSALGELWSEAQGDSHTRPDLQMNFFRSKHQTSSRSITHATNMRKEKKYPF